MGDCRRMITGRKEEEDRLEQKREMRVMGQQRKRWRPVMRELVRKIPYYIDGHSYELSSIIKNVLWVECKFMKKSVARVS